MKRLNSYKCIECGNDFTSREREAKFCSRSCSAKYNNKNRIQNSDTRCKISLGVKKYHSENENVKNIRTYSYKCKKCGQDFITSKKVKKDRNAHCDTCKRRTSHLQDLSNIDTLLKLSKRTVSKVLKRMGLGCSICGWDLCMCDVHHIIPRKKGGSNQHENLTYLCPNCHRMIHNGLIKIEKVISMANYVGDKWKMYYGENFKGKVTSSVCKTDLL